MALFQTCCRPCASALVVKSQTPAMEESGGRWDRLACRVIPLWLQVGVFIARLPANLDRQALDTLLCRLQTKPRARVDSRRRALRRLARLGRRWLRLPWLRQRNNCYVRAFVQYRFLDTGGEQIRYHIGVEPPRHAGDRLRGHAWVSIGGEEIDPPDPWIRARMVPLLDYPALEGDADRRDAGSRALETLPEELPLDSGQGAR